jgi:hypothetical protein
VKLDRTELCAVLLALDLLSTHAPGDVLAASTRAELERARVLLLAALVDASTTGRVKPWAKVGAAASSAETLARGTSIEVASHDFNGAAVARRRSSSTTRRRR